MQLLFDFGEDFGYFVDVCTKLCAKALKVRNLVMFWDLGLKHNYFTHVNNLWRLKK